LILLDRSAQEMSEMVKCVRTKAIACCALLISIAAMVSCAGNPKSITTPPPSNIAGPWEFIATSQTGAGTGVVTGIEVALSEGQVLVDGINQPNGQITASSNQISFVSLDPTTLNISEFGGPCQQPPGVSGLTGSITSPDSPIQFTFTENGNVFNVTATLSGDGKSLLNGTYTAGSSSGTSNPCTADSGGTITGTMVARISGTFTGTMCALADTSSPCRSTADNVTAAVSENSSNNLTVNLTLTGGDNETLTLTGPVTGNSFSLTGQVGGQVVEYFGYYETVNNVPSIYFANATNPASPNYVGTLALPH
jgi:hypothetical protein